MHVLDAIETAQWAMLPEWVERLRTVAAREHEITTEALEAYRSMNLARAERARTRDGVAILDVIGPMFARANMMVEVSGAMSYQIMMRDLRVALDDPGISGILLNIDSPGGEVTGADELSKAIYEARERKPIYAYVSGSGASAAYWIASAASKIILAETASVGSIGVVGTFVDNSAQDEKRGVKRYEIVSSQSPDKRPDITSDAGRARIQRNVDAMADVFVSSVARYRGVKADEVLQKFGRGGMEVGREAVALGMADEIGTFEGALRALVQSGTRRTTPNSRGMFMSEKTGATTAESNVGLTADDVRKQIADAQKAYQARVAGIMGAEAAKTLPTLANVLAFKTDLSAEDAAAVMEAAKADMPKVEKLEAVAGTIQQPSFVERKAAVGAIVPGTEHNLASDQSKSAWSKAVENANKRFGALSA